MKTLDKTILDYEQQIMAKIDANKDNKLFPQKENYGLTDEKLTDYLFDKQAVMDMAGSKQSQYTVFGILVVLPILVMSAFPQDSLPFGKWTLFVGVLIGLGLAVIVKLVIKVIISIKLKKLYKEDIERYLSDVLNFK